MSKLSVEQLEEELKLIRISTFDKIQMEEIVHDLLIQQFYKGNDFLTDRFGIIEYKVPGADLILNSLREIIVIAGRYWLEGNCADTLKEFAVIFDLHYPVLISNLVNKLRNINFGSDEMDGEIVFSMALGEALMQFRIKVSIKTRKSIIIEADKLGIVDRIGHANLEDIITGELKNNYSILLTLHVLSEYARITEKSSRKITFDQITQQLLSEFQKLNSPIN